MSLTGHIPLLTHVEVAFPQRMWDGRWELRISPLNGPTRAVATYGSHSEVLEALEEFRVRMAVADKLTRAL